MEDFNNAESLEDFKLRLNSLTEKLNRTNKASIKIKTAAKAINPSISNNRGEQTR